VCWELILRKACRVLRAFVADEQGQSTVEYVFLLGVLVIIILTIGKTLRSRLLALVQSKLQTQIQNNMFSNGGVHKFSM